MLARRPPPGQSCGVAVTARGPGSIASWPGHRRHRCSRRSRRRPASAGCSALPRNALTIPVVVEVVSWVLGCGCWSSARSGATGRASSAPASTSTSASPTPPSPRPGWSASAATSRSTSSRAASSSSPSSVGVPLLVLGRYALRTRGQERPPPRRAAPPGASSPAPPLHIDEIARVLRRETWLGYDVMGALTPPDRLPRGDHARASRCWGNTDDVAWAGRRRCGADMVFFAGGALQHVPRRCARPCGTSRTHDVQVVVAPSVTDVVQRARARPPGRRAAAHAPRPAARGGTPPAGPSAPSTSSARPPDPGCSSPAARVRRRSASGCTTAARSLFRQTRVGRDGKRVRLPQVPHDGRRRRGAARRRSSEEQGARRRCSSR